ncbi:hypothetical protein EJD97_011258 [Solanum chilense]|uniref:Defensin-like protein n=1 Tax=Solanum chilense TaxID=4083 RepID=A0A6N2BFT9_SOLCI|nr:hypothetical protein EJD97_011258 [Solanum chilense]
MAKLSSTLCFFLLLVCAIGTSGIRDTASIGAHVIVRDDQCLTALGVCSEKVCDEQCCENKCISSFKTKNPNGGCETLPGSALRICNCHHDC